MAILKNLDVKIKVDRQQLQEYANDEIDQLDNPDSMTKYVEAKSGARFVVHIKVKQAFKFTVDALQFSLYVDGQAVNDILILREDHNRGQAIGKTFQGADVGGDDGRFRLQPFIFSDVRSVEDPDSSEAADLDKLGTVVVKVSRHALMDSLEDAVSCTTPRSEDSETFLASSSPLGPSEDSDLGTSTQSSTYATTLADEASVMDEAIEISETHLKGESVTHCVRLGAEEDAPMWYAQDVEDVDDPAYPYATFTFKYRSKDALRGLLLIPRSPSPAPIPLEDRPYEELTQQNKDELLQMLLAERRQNKKAEIRSNVDPNRVKEEPGRVWEDPIIVEEEPSQTKQESAHIKQEPGLSEPSRRRFARTMASSSAHDERMKVSVVRKASGQKGDAEVEETVTTVSSKRVKTRHT